MEMADDVTCVSHCYMCCYYFRIMDMIPMFSGQTILAFRFIIENGRSSVSDIIIYWRWQLLLLEPSRFVIARVSDILDENVWLGGIGSVFVTDYIREFSFCFFQIITIIQWRNRRLLK